MKYIILHGSKLLPTGNLSPDMQNRIGILKDVLKREKHDLLIISGGISSKVQIPESQVILDNIKDFIDIPVKLESTSKTTVQNILNSLKHIESSDIDQITVITSKGSFRRVKRLYKLYVSQYFNRIEFVVAENTASFKTFVWEALIYVVYLIDPKEFWMRPFINHFRS